MPFPNIFTPQVSGEIIHRIEQLTPQTQALWGKMNVAQMLAHCNVTYEMLYENRHKAPNAFMRIVLKLLVKKTVVGEGAYKKSSQTAPAFVIADARDFEAEKTRLITFIQRVQQQGEKEFEGRHSHSFGKLTSKEWNNLFWKHLNHHLSQFGV